MGFSYASNLVFTTQKNVHHLSLHIVVLKNVKFNATSLIESGVFKPTKDLLNMLIV